MLLRRLYSSLPQRAASTPSSASASASVPKPASRGRTRPVRVKAARVKPAAPESSVATSHGRRLRRTMVARPASDFYSSEMPRPAPSADGAGFQPVTLYPFQAGLHLSFTPRHMPLPVHIGTKGYLSPEAAQADELFSRPAAPSLLEGVQLSAASPIAEHLGLTQAFAHPALAHHLGRNAAALSTVDVDADMRVESLLSAAAAKHADAASDAWAAALERLGAKATEPTVSAAEQASIDDAIAGLNGLLARLETADVEDEFVRMDSVRRKRKKKMNKHKYKKRRKATRSERRRLGK